MIGLKFWPLVLKQVVRHRIRSILTIAGVAIAMYLFVAIQAMQQGVTEATQASAAGAVPPGPWPPCSTARSSSAALKRS